MNLRVQYLGLQLANPLIVGASPFCDDVDAARELANAGAAAVVMRSLFHEQLVAAAASACDPGLPDVAYSFSPNEYLHQLERLKRALAIPVIASLSINGSHPAQANAYARKLESAGADAIELNLYSVVTDPAVAADQIEIDILKTAGAVAGSVRIPVVAKLSPFHSSVVQLAVALELVGVAGVVVFNRFCQPDIDIHAVRVQPSRRLSNAADLLLRLRWLAILSPCIRGSLCASGGIGRPADMIKALLTGAHAVQVVSALLKPGPKKIPALLAGLCDWMEQHHYSRIDQFRGKLSLERCPSAPVYERAHYICALQGRAAKPTDSSADPDPTSRPRRGRRTRSALSA